MGCKRVAVVQVKCRPGFKFLKKYLAVHREADGILPRKGVFHLF